MYTQRSLTFSNASPNSRACSLVDDKAPVRDAKCGVVGRNQQARQAGTTGKFAGHSPLDARPIEMYVYPPAGDQVFPGDVLSDQSGQFWIVMTPACDFAQNKAEAVLMCAIVPLKDHPLFVEWRKAEKEKDKQRSESRLRNLLRNGAGERWRFLPRTFFHEGGVVDFQRLLQLPLNDVDPKRRICSLDSPYSEEMLLAFSRYYGRIGTPDLASDGVWKYVSALAGQ